MNEGEGFGGFEITVSKSILRVIICFIYFKFLIIIFNKFFILEVLFVKKLMQLFNFTTF